MTNSSLNILAWYDTKGKQDHRRWWSYGEVHPMVTEFNHIPNFQMVRAQTGAAITELALVRLDDASEVDVLALATSLGLEVATFTDYDLIIYPDLLPLGLNIDYGVYYLRMSDGIDTWESDVFSMCDDLAGLVKIEYWHTEDFKYPNGHIRYLAPYKSKVFFDSDIGKPSYEYEEQVSKNDGYNFPLSQISYKKFKFKTILPEYVIDAIRVIGLHDDVEISYNGRTYVADEFLMISPEWAERGNLAVVDFEFRTDTVVSIKARGVVDAEYLPTEGSCVATLHTCVAQIDEDSSNYTNFTYTHATTNQPVNLLDGDKVVISLIAGYDQVFTYNSSSYSVEAIVSGSNIFEENTNSYYIGSSLDRVSKPRITSYNSNEGTLTATAMFGAIHQIYSVSQGIEVLQKTLTYAELHLTDVNITYSPSFEYFRMKISSIVCGMFQTTEDFEVIPPTLTGIGVMEIESTFIVG